MCSKRFTAKGEQYQPFPDGFFQAAFEKFSEKETINGDAWAFHFIVQEPGYEGRRIIALTDPNTRIKSKAWRIIRALTGKALKESDVVDEVELVGKQCFLDVEYKINERTKKPNNNVKDYISLRDFEFIKRNDK